MPSQSVAGSRERGLFREAHGIAVAMVPEDLEIYRSLLPSALSMPERPIVSAWVISWDDVARLRPYLEGAIRLRCAHHGKVGWFIVTMPVTSLGANLAGRMMAFPKYVADEIALDTSREGPVGEVRHRSECQLSIELSPGSTKELTLQQREDLREGTAIWGAPYYFLILAGGVTSRWRNWLWRMWQGLRDERRVLVRPGEDSALLRITEKTAVPEIAELSQPGAAHVAVNPSAPWARIFPGEKDVLGAVFHWKGGVSLATEELF